MLETADCQHIVLDGTRVCYIEAPAGAAGTVPESRDSDCEHCFVIDGRVKVCTTSWRMAPLGVAPVSPSIVSQSVMNRSSTNIRRAIALTLKSCTRSLSSP